MSVKKQISSLSAFTKANKKASILSELNLRLFVAVTLGTKEEVSKLVLEEGADVHALNFNQVSPVDLAKAFGRQDVLEILLSASAGTQNLPKILPKILPKTKKN